jgi:dihydrofolate reductase
VLIYGSAQLVQTLSEFALIDAYEFVLHPVIVGYGKRLLPDGVVASRLSLVGTGSLPAGVVLLTYAPAEHNAP